MSDMKPYTTKLPDNTAEWFDNYVDEEGVTTSAALRQLVEKEKHRDELTKELSKNGVAGDEDDEDGDSINVTARQAPLASIDTLTLLVSTLTFLLVGAAIVGGGL